MDLPKFVYHPNPVKTGSVVESKTECECCERSRGYIYTGPVFAEDELDDCICPWCIADGSAHSKFDAEFIDSAGVGGYGTWDSVPVEVVEAVAFRTPGFTGWQQERWWTHCGDAAEFLGVVGASGAKAFGDRFLEAIREEAGLVGDPYWDVYFAALDASHGPTAYAFKCRHCSELGGYSDCH